VFWTVIYNIFFVPVLWLIKQVMKLINPKVKERERNWKGLLLQFEKIKRDEHSKYIWFHASSMGEFEQAKPIIEMLKKNNKDVKIIVTFYSPSGYNNQKNYKYADAFLYMPFDSISGAKKIIKLIKPDLAVFVRYEIWRNHLWILKQSSIPTYLICATAPRNKLLRKILLIGSLMKSNYNLFDKIYTASETETKQFRKMKINTELMTASDTRFDRIVEKANESRQKQIIPPEMFKGDSSTSLRMTFVLVAGSTWDADEDIIIDTVKQFEKENHEAIRLILVPHEPTEKHIEKVKHKLPNSFLLSEILNFLSFKRDENEIKNFLGWNHIIVDSIGHLLSLYSLADAAYIGGGFGAGVHSVTEPAGYGIPLATGIKFHNSPDAVSLHKLGGLEIIKNKDDFYEWLKKLLEATELKNELGLKAIHYVNKHTGSTKLIVDEIASVLNKSTKVPPSLCSGQAL